MDCQDFLYQANTLIDGELSPAEAAALNAHLGECESCARICAELKYVKRLVQEKVERPVPPPQLLKRLAEGQGLRLRPRRVLVEEVPEVGGRMVGGGDREKHWRTRL